MLLSKLKVDKDGRDEEGRGVVGWGLVGWGGVGRGGLDGGGRRVLLVAFNGGYLFGVQQYNLNRTSVIAS